jgi:5-oxoprolinase (ATP-hydrolysing)
VSRRLEEPPHIVGVDIGGTFTDVVLYAGAQQVGAYKLLTTPDDPANAVLEGIHAVLDEYDVEIASVGWIVHSTTLATNAVIERKGAPVGLLVTRGFADQLELRSEQRYDIHDMYITYPEPLVPRKHRAEVDERVLATGQTVAAPEQSAVLKQVDQLLDDGVTSLAVSLIHAYQFPDHEEQIRSWIAEAHPDVPVSSSFRVAAVEGEYQRTETTIADAYVKPIVDTYVSHLLSELHESGFRGDFNMVLSSGMATSIATAREYPVRLIESGPAAGAVATGYYSDALGLEDVLAFDMGGTTAKASILVDGEPAISDQIEVARVHRFKSGSGIPLRIPSIDLIEIGAGGGSIAWVDSLGLLKVGPESAGASPGPACYGNGGEAPTVTDANLLLGYLNPDHFLGGRMSLDVGPAEEAVSRLAHSLGLPLMGTAFGINEVVNEMMAQAARAQLIENNRDPRNVSLIAFGGAGPVHATAVARKLGSRTVICPPGAGTLSALGCLAAPYGFENVRSFSSRIGSMDWAGLNETLNQMQQEAITALENANQDPASAVIQREAELRMVGQFHELRVPLPPGQLDEESETTILESFHDIYVSRYQRFVTGYPIEVVSLRLRVTVPSGLTASPVTWGDFDTADAYRGKRKAYFDREFQDVPVYDRYRLITGAEISGPAIVEERESTALLHPGDTGRIDDFGNLVIQIGAR